MFKKLRPEGKERWLFRLFKEGVLLTTKQYGACIPRTQGSQPPNNTPLMTLAKAPFPGVGWQIYHKMMECIIDNGGNPALVDNLGVNAFMHAAGHGNSAFVEWFYKRVDHCKRSGFDFNHKNDEGRNVLSMLMQRNSHPGILAKMKDLAVKGHLDEVVHVVDAERPWRFGGTSGARQRSRPRIRHADDKTTAGSSDDIVLV